MAALPPDFKPVVSGYRGEEPGGVMRTDVAGGSPRYGLMWDRGPQQFVVTLILDALQFSVWTAFYHHIIRKGSLAFDMMLDSGLGSSVHSVNIVPGTYSFARTSGIMVSVAFTVEAENQIYQMTAAEAALLMDLYTTYGHRSDALLQRIALFANFDSDVLDF